MKYLRNLLFLTAAAAFLFSAGCVPSAYTPVRIAGSNMLPALKPDDRVLLETDFGELKRGDIISYLYPKDQEKHYISRVIALPNETVEIREGRVLVDGRELDEPYVDPVHNQNKPTTGPRTVAPESYYVLGDNRDNASDSRYWGTVPRKLVVGRRVITY